MLAYIRSFFGGNIDVSASDCDNAITDEDTADTVVTTTTSSPATTTTTASSTTAIGSDMTTNTEPDMAEIMATMPLPQVLQQQLKDMVEGIYGVSTDAWTRDELLPKMLDYTIPDNVHLKALLDCPVSVGEYWGEYWGVNWYADWGESGQRVLKYYKPDLALCLNNRILTLFRPETTAVLHWYCHVSGLYLLPAGMGGQVDWVNSALLPCMDTIIKHERTLEVMARAVQYLLKQDHIWSFLHKDKPFELVLPPNHADGKRRGHPYVRLFLAYALDVHQHRELDARCGGGTDIRIIFNLTPGAELTTVVFSCLENLEVTVGDRLVLTLQMNMKADDRFL